MNASCWLFNITASLLLAGVNAGLVRASCWIVMNTAVRYSEDIAWVHANANVAKA